MSDATFAAYEAKCARAAALEDEILPHNKQVLFEVLAEAGVATIVVAFDGYGDNGQIEQVVAFDEQNNELAIPDREIAVKAVEFDTSAAIERTSNVREFIEALAYDLL